MSFMINGMVMMSGRLLAGGAGGGSGGGVLSVASLRV
jgi:hypothetical protein